MEKFFIPTLKYILLIFTLPLLIITWFMWIVKEPINNNLYQLGVSALQEANWQTAINDLTEAINNKVIYNTPIDMAYLFRAQAYHALKQYQLALNDTIMGQKDNPKSVPLALEMTSLYLKLNQPQQALQTINHAINLSNNNTEITNNDLINQRMQIYLLLKQNENALNDLNQLLQVDNQNIIYLQLKAGLYQKMQSYQKAIDIYSRIITLFPTEASSYNARANLYAAIGKKQLSEKDTNKFNELIAKTNVLNKN